MSATAATVLANRPVAERSRAGEQESGAVRRHALLREVNDRISEIAGRFDLTESFSIHCECGSPDCHELFELSRAEYEHIRRTSTHFAFVRGHDTPAIERVVQEHEGFVTVQAFG
jgi:hypothetical protein